MTIAEIVAKRKRIWEKRQDIQYDAQFVKAVAREITHIDNKNLRAEIKAKPYLLIEACFTIVNKAKKTVPFFLNEVQQDFIRQLENHGGGTPYYILKGRQQGFTTLITAIQLSYAIVSKNFEGFTLADSDDNAQAIFRDKAKSVYDRLPDELKPTIKQDSARKLFFNVLNSSWEVAPATERVGRSRTLVFLHQSECAFYKSLASLEKGISQALTKNAIVIYETTANGFNEAKTLWDNNSCHNLFYEWWRTSEYTDDDLSQLDTNDEWLINRIDWLRNRGITESQIAWYCKKYNGYIDKQSIKQEYPCTPEEAFIATGRCVFNQEAIIMQLERIRDKKPVKQGYFKYTYNPLENKIEDDSIEFVDDKSGSITIYKDVEERTPYVIGGDTAGEGSDFFTGQALDNTTGEQVAVLRQDYDEDLYTKQMYCLGKYYNEALIAIEVNYSRKPVNDLQDMNYPKQYVRETIDQISKEYQKKFGFLTSSITRTPIINNLVEIIRDNAHLINDIATLKELLTFVKNDRGRAEAQQGENDDLVMALAIAYNARPQQTFKTADVPPPIRKAKLINTHLKNARKII